MGCEALTAPAKQRKAELARELGVSRQAIGDLVSRGILIEDDDGMIDGAAARKALTEHVRPSAKTALALTDTDASGSTPATPPPADPSAPADPAAKSETVTSFHVARTMNEAALAQINQLKLREMQGELIRVKAVESVWASALASMREHLWQVRARLAPLLAAESDPFAVDQLLEAEHAAALEFMAAATFAGKGETP